MAHSDGPIAEPRPARSALTKTGGFLAGYTHTLQPYIGCRFGCAYCYVQGLAVHHFHQPALAWGEYVHARTGIAQRLQDELARRTRRGTRNELAIFMSSATDPYQGAERRWRLSRACLDAFLAQPPGILVVQTRSPLAQEDFPRLAALGEACWLSVTLETDREDVRQALTPRCPSVDARWRMIAAAQEAGVQVQVAVSPCLPYSDVETFGARLLAVADRIVVDSFVSGDGQGGKRTARTDIPGRFAAHNLGAWAAEDAGQALYQWLVAERGAETVGWSQAGFTALTARAAPAA